MSWQDKLLPASFKGIPFSVEDAETKGGKRIVGYEFPKLNTPASEDMGRKQRSYNISAFVLGDDFKERSEELIEACESELAGVLIHPVHGEIKVHCTEYSVRYSFNKDGRLALISISFLEAGQELYPESISDNKAELAKTKEAAIKSSKEEFLKKYSVAGKGQVLLNSASTQLGTWTGKMSSIVSSGRGESNTIASLGYSLSNMNASVTDSVRDPSKLANNFGNSISGVKNAFSKISSNEALGAYKKLFKTDNSSSYNSNPLTETRKQELQNQKAIDDLAVNVSTIEAVSVASEMKFESLKDAETTRDELLLQIDTIAKKTDSDDLYRDITLLRSIFVSMIPAEENSLPLLKKVSAVNDENVIGLSYRLYGHLDYADLIATRNKISQTIIIPSNLDLEVPVE